MRVLSSFIGRFFGHKKRTDAKASSAPRAEARHPDDDFFPEAVPDLQAHNSAADVSGQVVRDAPRRSSPDHGYFPLALPHEVQEAGSRSGDATRDRTGAGMSDGRNPKPGKDGDTARHCEASGSGARAAVQIPENGSGGAQEVAPNDERSERGESRLASAQEWPREAPRKAPRPEEPPHGEGGTAVPASASPSSWEVRTHTEVSANQTDEDDVRWCPSAPEPVEPCPVGDTLATEAFDWVPAENPPAAPGPAVPDGWIDLPTRPIDETEDTGEPATGPWPRERTFARGRWQAVPWIVSRRASAIVEKLSIYERRAIDEAFDRVVVLLTRFPHPSSARGIEALAEAGASLETIEDAARLKTFWADSPGLWLVRRYSRLHGTIVPGRVLRNGAHLMTWALAARVLTHLDVEAAETAISTDWLQDWLAMRFPGDVADAGLRAGYFTFTAYVDVRAASPGGDDGEFMRISPARLRYAFA